MAKSFSIPLLEPIIFKEKLIQNKNESLLNNHAINDFFIHNFKEESVQLKLPLPPHKKTVHDFVITFKGSMIKSIGLEHFELKNNRFLFTPKNNITTTQEVSQDLEGYYCHFSNQFLPNHPYLKLWLTNSISKNLILLHPKQIKSLRFLLERMHTLYNDTKEKESNYNLIHYYLSVFIAEISIISEEHYSKTRISSIASRFQELIHQHFKNSRSLQYYANLIHVSPNHLNKTIKKETGKSATQIINDLCILEAQVLLSQTTLDVRQIVHALGFDDSSYFSRFFKKHTQFSPLKYRKMIDLS